MQVLEKSSPSGSKLSPTPTELGDVEKKGDDQDVNVHSGGEVGQYTLCPYLGYMASCLCSGWTGGLTRLWVNFGSCAAEQTMRRERVTSTGQSISSLFLQVYPPSSARILDRSLDLIIERAKEVLAWWWSSLDGGGREVELSRQTTPGPDQYDP